MKQILLLLGIAGTLLLPACKKNTEASSQPVDISTLKPVITEKGTAAGQASTASIGAEGGTVTSSDGLLSVTFPAGAFTENTEVGIQPVTNNCPLGLGLAYRLSPEGKTFSKPATLTFHYNAEWLGTTVEDFLWFTTQNAAGTWSGALKSVVDKAAKTVTVTAPHFSDWTVGRFVELVLEPVSPVVPVNKRVILAVAGFVQNAPPDPNDEELSPLIPVSQLQERTDLEQVMIKTKAYRAFIFKEWALNGKAVPVSNEFGKLEKVVPGAKYVAPAKTPSPATVAVSIRMEIVQSSRVEVTSVLLVSNITILEDGYYLKFNAKGKEYKYYQYGMHGQQIPDESDYSVVNFANNMDGSNGMAASRIVNGEVTDAFYLGYDDDGLGSRDMSCNQADKANHDDMAFTPGLDVARTLINSWTKRTKGESTCTLETFCAGMKIDITAIETEGSDTDISGSFSGMLYNAPDGYQDACKTDEPYPVSGEFRLHRVN